MFEVRERPEMVERAMLVGIYFDPREEVEAESLLEELHELVETLGINIVHTVFYRSRALHKQYLCGTGKAQEIVDLAIGQLFIGRDQSFFDCDLTHFRAIDASAVVDLQRAGCQHEALGVQQQGLLIRNTARAGLDHKIARCGPKVRS